MIASFVGKIFVNIKMLAHENYPLNTNRYCSCFPSLIVQDRLCAEIAQETSGGRGDSLQQYALRTDTYVRVAYTCLVIQML